MHKTHRSRGAALSFLDRLKIRLVSTAGYWVIGLIGKTLRWHVENGQALQCMRDRGTKVILAFWHGRIFTATYFFRRQGIVVMTSRNRDGEYIARVIEKFGYGAARGSSTRGSQRATVEILRALKNNRDVGITMDGPRGPRYVAKPGAAYLARKSGHPIVPFSISCDRKWVMRSWDHFQIPKPFSRAVVLIGNPIHADQGSDNANAGGIEARIQRSLDELRDRGDSWWGGKPDQ